MEKIEEYTEGLYEDITEKIKATRAILELSKSPQNLSILSENGENQYYLLKTLKI